MRAPVTCLWFASAAEEAMRRYAALFPDSTIERVDTLPADTPSGPPGAVTMIEFTLSGRPYPAIEAGSPDPFSRAMSLVAPCDDQAEIDRLRDALGDGGRTERCGWLRDRHGVRWQIVPAVLADMLADADRERAARVARAMLGMTKLDIAALERARDAADISRGS